jgi:hypothetical protein
MEIEEGRKLYSNHSGEMARIQQRPMGAPILGKLPNVGVRFLVGRVWYKVTYVNEGKRRFSSEPVVA